MHKTVLLLSFFLLIIHSVAAQTETLDSTVLIQKLIERGDSAMSLNDTVEAIKNYSEILNKPVNKISYNQSKSSGYVALQLSHIYFNQGNYTKSLDISIKGIKIIESTNQDADLLSNLYLNAGNIYSVFEDHEKANIYYNEGLKYVRQIKNYHLEAFFLNNLTAMCCYTKDIPQAIKYNNLAKDLPLDDTIKQYYYYELNNGLITLAQDKLHQAVIHFKKSIDYALNPGMSPKFLAASYSEIFKIFEETNELDSAIYYLEKYRELSEYEHYTYMQVDSYKTLSRLYNKINERDKALLYQEMYVELADSMMNNREFNRISNKQLAYEKDKSTSYINELTRTISEQKIILVTIITFLLILITLSVLLLLQKRKLQKAYHDIFDRNKELINIEEKYSQAIKTISVLKEQGITEVEDPQKPTGLKDEQRNDLLKKINEVMELTTHYCNPDFSLAELANLIGSNTKYVSQIINETYGINFRTFINDYRVKLSRKRLIDTEKYGNYTIKAIAESVGFKSQSNFILSFKKTTGITPSLYQSMAIKDKNSIN